jgi:uncharacterized protein (TIGR02145 family)
LPAAGFRGEVNATLGLRGLRGYYWSSAESGSNALHYYFDDTIQNPSFSNARNIGASVRCIEDNSPTASITALNCGSKVQTGSLGINTAASGVSITVPYTGGNSGDQVGQSVASTGVTGLTATFTGGIISTSGNFTYTITGTPASAGTASFAISVGGQSCTLTATVSAAPVNPVGTGSLSGKTCFDVALGNDNTNGCGTLSGRTSQQANFTQMATNTQNYSFTPSGTVSNVRFVYVNTNGAAITAISGNNSGNNLTGAIIAQVTYDNMLNTSAAGRTASNAITADIYVIYNNGATNNGTDLQLKLTANIKDCACCGAMISATVYKEFLCHNLGADTTLDPHDMSQTNAWGLNGAYVQWGRRGPNTTGDSRVDWRTAANTSNFGAAPTGSTVGTANSAAISGWSGTPASDFSWRTAAGAKTANDPCPAGWRVPTSAEWTGVISNNTASRSGVWTTSSTYYNSALHYGPNVSSKLLTLPAAGHRTNADGSLGSRGGDAYYWSSDGSSNIAPNLYFSNSISRVDNANARNNGFLVRCISE